MTAGSARVAGDVEAPNSARTTVSRDVLVPMRDGVRLCADVYRPDGHGPYPVLVIRVPYPKQHAQTIVYAHPHWYAARGYIVVVQNTRGRYASEGDFEPWRNEGRDGYDTVEWAASLPQANGRVGMYGFSYAGTLQLQAAALRPPHLCAIAPAFSSLDLHGEWIYPGGALSWAFVASWCPSDLAAESARRAGNVQLEEKLAVSATHLPDSYWHLPICEYPDLPRQVAPYFHDWLAHPERDKFWQELDSEAILASIEIPALHVSGWSDVFVDGTLRSFVVLAAGAHSEQRLLVGPWMHMPWTPWVVPGGQAVGFGDIDLIQIEWFDRWLKPDGLCVPESRDPDPVRVFTMGAERWTSLGSWPQSSGTARLYLHSMGRANSRFGDGTLAFEPPAEEECDLFVFEPKNPVPSLGGRSCCDHALAPIGVLDQRIVEERRDVLVYSSAQLEQPLEVRGAVTLVIWAASSAVDTDFTGKLVDVYPDGKALNVVDGIVRARYREGIDHEVLLEPDEVYRFQLDLGSISWRFAAGHRLRLEVSSSSFPRYNRNANSRVHPNQARFSDLQTAVQRVFHDQDHPSVLLVPLAEAEE